MTQDSSKVVIKKTSIGDREEEWWLFIKPVIIILSTITGFLGVSVTVIKRGVVK